VPRAALDAIPDGAVVALMERSASAGDEIEEERANRVVVRRRKNNGRRNIRRRGINTNNVRRRRRPAQRRRRAGGNRRRNVRVGRPQGGNRRRGNQRRRGQVVLQGWATGNGWGTRHLGGHLHKESGQEQDTRNALQLQTRTMWTPGLPAHRWFTGQWIGAGIHQPPGPASHPPTGEYDSLHLPRLQPVVRP